MKDELLPPEEEEEPRDPYENLNVDEIDELLDVSWHFSCYSTRL
jgi:hypothetical protein